MCTFKVTSCPSLPRTVPVLTLNILCVGQTVSVATLTHTHTHLGVGSGLWLWALPLSLLFSFSLPPSPLSNSFPRAFNELAETRANTELWGGDHQVPTPRPFFPPSLLSEIPFCWNSNAPGAGGGGKQPALWMEWSRDIVLEYKMFKKIVR